MMKKADHKKSACEETVTAMKPVRLCSASDRIEADMMIDILNQNGIQAFFLLVLETQLNSLIAVLFYSFLSDTSNVPKPTN